MEDALLGGRSLQSALAAILGEGEHLFLSHCVESKAENIR